MSSLRVRVWDFMTELLRDGTWNKKEAEDIKELSGPKDGKWVRDNLQCVVCEKSMMEGVINYQYMLRNDVWASAGLRPRDLAHLHCVELRLGRDLEQVDFTKVPMNGLIHWLFDQEIIPPKN